jgi:hypothetical protein
LPAYGRALLERRRAGDHPDLVYVIIGDDWGRLPIDAHVCIKPDRAPGTTDWLPLAGVAVRMVVRDIPMGFERLLAIAGEVACVAAPIHLYWFDEAGRADCDAGWAAQHLLPNPPGTLPRPWTLALLADYARRCDAFERAQVEEVAA